ncbi:MAG: hypothetical protein ACOX9R_17985 [Armatimonadota bacterium]
MSSYLKNTVGVNHAVGFNRTMHAKLGHIYGEEFWTHFQQYQWVVPVGSTYPPDQVRQCAQDAVVGFWEETNSIDSALLEVMLLISDGLDPDTNEFFVVADNYEIDRYTMQIWSPQL